MGNNNKQDFIGWLGLNHLREFDFSKARWLGPIISGILGAVVFALVIIAGAILLRLTGVAIGFPFKPNSPDIRDMGFLLAALFGAPFVVWRASVAQKQANTAEQGLITDRINKAVEGLGTEKTVKRVNKDGNTEEFTEANIAVRIGAIYSLERIAQDSNRDHDQETIIQILAAYIVNESQATVEIRGVWNKLRHDLDVAVQTLANCRDLFGNRPGKANVMPDLRLANFHDALLHETDFQNCGLNIADFSKSTVTHTSFTSANLSGANFNSGTFTNCRFTKTKFYKVKMNRETKFTGSTFQSAGFHKLDFTDVDISLEQIESAFGDATVILPELLANNRPAHWPREELSLEDFIVQWEAWKKGLAPNM